MTAPYAGEKVTVLPWEFIRTCLVLLFEAILYSRSCVPTRRVSSPGQFENQYYVWEEEIGVMVSLFGLAWAHSHG